MKIPIADITDKMTAVLQAKGYAADDIPFIINMYLGGELRGHTSHGLASFAGFANDDFSDRAEPEVLKQTHSVFMVDAKARSGNVIGKRAADEAVKRAKEEIAGISIIKNMDSWLRPGAIAEYIADQGLVALVINSGGGASVAPPGGFDAVVGTNPIAYGVPTHEGSLVVDMATAKRAWGQVRLANKYGTELPPDSFYDKTGKVTLDPKEAWSVMPFGDYKGFSLALFIEMMCGAFVGMPMMITDSNTGSQFGVRMLDRGGIIVAFDPAQIGSLDDFKAANSDLIRRIKATHARDGESIRIPGEEATRVRAENINQGSLEIPDELWQEINGL